MSKLSKRLLSVEYLKSLTVFNAPRNESVPTIVVIVALWVAGLCAAAQFAKVAVALPELALLYPGAGRTLGFIVSLVSLMGALFGLSAGALAARVSLRKLLLFGMISGSVISLLQSLELPLPLLLASRALEGLSHLAIVISAPTLISMASNDQLRSSAMTLWGTFFGVSFALTAWLGLPLIELRGVSALFLAHGIFMATITVLVWLVVPALSNKSAHKTTRASIGSSYKRALLSPHIAAPAVGWLFYTLTFVALLALLPQLVKPDLRTVTSTLLPVASIASSMTLGVALLFRTTAVTVICTGFICAIGMVSVMFYQPDSLLVYTLLFASLGLIQGASFAAIPQLNPDSNNQVLANGAIAQAGNIGNLMGTPLLIWALSIGGVNAVIVMTITCYSLALIGHLTLSRRRKNLIV